MEREVNGFDVVIVGAGPVGLTLAALLGRAGHSVLVVERHQDLYGLPRAIRFDGEAMRLFQGLGITDEIASEIVPSDSYVWYGADGEVIFEIDSSASAPSGWAASYAFWQPTLETALESAVLRAPSVQILRGWAAEDVDDPGDLPRVHLRHGGEPDRGRWIPGDETRAVTARFVVGADGANSVVRRACGIGQEDFGFRERWLVVDVRPHDMSRWTDGPVAAQRCDPRRPTVWVRNGSSHRRWEFMLMPGEATEGFRDPAVVWELLSPYLSPQEGTLVRHAVYEFTGTLANELRQGHVLLAGDAAHTMPPFLAEGMCTGLRDAASLAWRLDLLLNDVGGDHLLDDYGLERRPHAQALIELSIALGKVACTIDPVQARERDAAFRAGHVPPPPPLPGLTGGTLQTPDPFGVAGQLTVQGRVRAPEGRPARFDDVVGPGFAVVALHGDPAAVLQASQRAFLRSINAHVVTLDRSVPAALEDADGLLSSWMAERHVAAFIARPDGYGFGAAGNVADLPALVDDLRGRLSPTVSAPS